MPKYIEMEADVTIHSDGWLGDDPHNRADEADEEKEEGP